LCAAEDTNKSKILMNKYGIKTRLISYHKHSEEKKLNYFLKKLQSGEDIALISDSGTPLISDPGYLLVKEALNKYIKIVPIPGPSSVIAALSVSGLPLDEFTFYGFPPRQKEAQRTFINQLILNRKTSVIFESKNRIKGFLQNLADISPNRAIFLAREITKIYETFYRGNVSEVLNQISSLKSPLKGEFVLVVGGGGKSVEEVLLTNEQKRVLKILLAEMNKNDALTLASKSFGIRKNTLYKIMLKQKNFF